MVVTVVDVEVHFPDALYATQTGDEKIPWRCNAVGSFATEEVAA